MDIFFTADTHFGHERVIKYCNRPFPSGHDMDEALIKNWNSIVRPTDSVYHLGDVSMVDPVETKKILGRLNGKIYLLRGNHDSSAENIICLTRFDWIKDYHVMTVSGRYRVVLMHYPLRVWTGKSYGSLHLHGHSHGSVRPEPQVYSLDVGVDSWDYSPAPLDAVLDKMRWLGWSGNYV